MMTRNDFELLAGALQSAHVACTDLATGQVGFHLAVNAVAKVCEANNARFNRAKFFAACSIDGVNQAN